LQAVMQTYLVCSNDSLPDTWWGIRDVNMSKLNNDCYWIAIGRFKWR
jgi:hypothetical protein